MFVELVDQLRCPVQHEDTWLVLAAEVTCERHVLTGTLGCPVCNSRFPVRQGTVVFTGTAGPDGRGAPVQASRGAAAERDGAEWPLRLAAFLGLGDATGIVGLYGAWAQHADALGNVVDGIEVIAIAPDAPTIPMISAIIPPSPFAIPLADGSLRAVAVDGSGDDPRVIAEAARLLRPAGRLLAPARAPIPPGVHELARDSDWWVGESEAVPAGIIPIAPRRRPPS